MCVSPVPSDTDASNIKASIGAIPYLFIISIPGVFSIFFQLSEYILTDFGSLIRAVISLIISEKQRL